MVGALKELSDAKAARGEDLLPLLASPHERIVTTALLALQASPSALAVDALIARGPDTTPDPLPALLAHVRAGLLDAALLDAAFARVRARWQSEPTTLTTCGLGAFLGRHKDALPTLIAATKHTDDFTRFDAARTLGEQADPDSPELPAVLDALRALSSDPAMPRKPSVSTAWSVGANAQRAIEKLLARRS